MVEDLSRDTKIYAKAFLYALAVMMLVLLAAVLYYLVHNGQQGAETRKLLIECTVPPEERTPPVKVSDPDADCYARSLSQQGSIVNSINSVSIVAATCGAAHPGDVPATRACVDSALKEKP